MKLYNHQQKLLDKNPDKCLIAWEVGTGKTLMALELSKNINRRFIVCPKSLKEQWEEQTPGSEPIYTKETFRRDWNKIDYTDCLIVDEAHFFFGMTGFRKRSGMLKALLSYIKKHNPPYIYLLTGTPYMSTPWNIYAAGQILGRDWNYAQFKDKFFYMVNMGGRYPVPIVKSGIANDIATIVSNIGDVVKMEDCFDVPEQVFQTEYFDLTTEQNKVMGEIDDEGIARWTKCHQISGGTLKGDGYTENASFKSEKMDRILELCKEHKKLIVVCRYNHEAKILGDKINGKTVFTINGSVKDRHSVVKLAEESDDCVVLVQAQCSEGYELPSFPVMVFYSYDFSLKNYIQMRGRILRANKLKKNVYLSLVVKNTIDEDVYKCIQAKKDFDIAIYDK